MPMLLLLICLILLITALLVKMIHRNFKAKIKVFFLIWVGFLSAFFIFFSVFIYRLS